MPTSQETLGTADIRASVKRPSTVDEETGRGNYAVRSWHWSITTLKTLMRFLQRGGKYFFKTPAKQTLKSRGLHRLSLNSKP